MPSTSGKQHRFMAAVANNPKFAKKAGVPQSVGEEFIKADKGRKFSDKGSEMKQTKGMKKMAGGGSTTPLLKEVLSSPAYLPKGSSVTPTPIQDPNEPGRTEMRPGVPGSAAGMTRPSMPKISTDEAPMKSAPVRRRPTPSPVRGTQRDFAGGGLAAGHKQADGVAQRGKTRGMEIKMAAGGLAAGHKQADGCAQRGKTRGMQVKMAKGGKC
jgi:hypothetical protein